MDIIANNTIKAFAKMLELSRKIASSVSDCDSESVVKQVNEVALALITKIISADNKINVFESDFLNAILTLQNSPSENLEVLRVYSAKWDNLLAGVPEFVTMAVQSDRQNNTRNAAVLVDCLKTVGNCASLCDKKQSLEEQQVLSEYISALENYLAAEGVSAKPQDEITRKHDEDGQQKSPNDTQVIQPAAVAGQTLQKTATQTLQEKAAIPVKNLEESMAELDALVGLQSVKLEVRKLTNLIKVQKLRLEKGLPNSPMSLHLVFSGNPGTGKTTIARLLANIYRALGLLSQGHLVETDRGGLVAGYVGQTAIKTKDIVKKAIGGVLFIDEAYTLSSSKGESDYGQEAIDTLLKLMEDNRKELIVIVAGYTQRMSDFINANPGLESRFNKHIEFSDYSPDELYEIFLKQCVNGGYTYNEEFGLAISALLQSEYKKRTDKFGNARLVRNIFETIISNQANRLGVMANPSEQELRTLSSEDLPEAALPTGESVSNNFSK